MFVVAVTAVALPAFTALTTEPVRALYQREAQVRDAALKLRAWERDEHRDTSRALERASSGIALLANRLDRCEVGYAKQTNHDQTVAGKLAAELRSEFSARTVAEACLEQERHMRVELAHVSTQQGAVSDELHRELWRVAGDASRFRHMAAVAETQVRHQHLRWVEEQERQRVLDQRRTMLEEHLSAQRAELAAEARRVQGMAAESEALVVEARDKSEATRVELERQMEIAVKFAKVSTKMEVLDEASTLKEKLASVELAHRAHNNEHGEELSSLRSQMANLASEREELATREKEASGLASEKMAIEARLAEALRGAQRDLAALEQEQQEKDARWKAMIRAKDQETSELLRGKAAAEALAAAREKHVGSMELELGETQARHNEELAMTAARHEAELGVMKETMESNGSRQQQSGFEQQQRQPRQRPPADDTTTSDASGAFECMLGCGRRSATVEDRRIHHGDECPFRAIVVSSSGRRVLACDFSRKTNHLPPAPPPGSPPSGGVGVQGGGGRGDGGWQTIGLVPPGGDDAAEVPFGGGGGG